jgi:hypothetical protein
VTPSAGWSISSVAEPTNFQSSDESHDKYTLTVTNVGARAVGDQVKIIDKLPPQLLALEARVLEGGERAREGECTVAAEVTCTYEHPVPVGGVLLLSIQLEAPSPLVNGLVSNQATVSDGEGGEASATESTAVNIGPAAFGINRFTFEATGRDGRPDSQGGDHPFQVTTQLDLNTDLDNVLPGSESELVRKRDRVVQAAKDITVELPLGFAGDPLAAERCPAIDLTDTEGAAGGGPGPGGLHTICPAGSRVGTVRLVWQGGGDSEPSGFPVYNVVPVRGYPAELGFNAGIGQPSFLYATVVPSPSGYRLRISSPGVLNINEVEQITFTTFGDPAEQDGTSGSAAFLTNPSRCSVAPLTAKVEVAAWEGASASAEATAYPDITGCNLLQQGAAFSPLIRVEPTSGEPEARQAGKPAGYEVNLKLPQAPNALGSLATPDLRDATVTLPQGVVLSPSSANGLKACPATGPEGINLEATEVGEGHPGGNASPYDDTLVHASPGHCPAASTLGTVEVTTPLLEGPLTGHVYLGEPDCSPCSPADAEDGKLVKLYIEVSNPTSGVIVKLPGVTTINQATGQLSGSFKENPQMPFEDFKLKFKSGPRAALVNPQACGTYTSTSDLMPWSAPESGPDATPSASLQINEGCGARGFAPAFSSGTTNAQAGTYSPLTMSFSRNDSEQDFLGLSETLPPGLLAKLAGVPQCGEAEANAGSCPESSQIGTVTTGAGPGPDPYYVNGKIYLTGPYNGGPFGEVVQVPAVAGPFNLGTVVVRGSIRINPTTAQGSIVSNPFPTALDGIPLQIKTVSVTINRPGFTFNPTNCSALAITGTLTSSQGAQAAVSNPFQAANCANLPFKPQFTASTAGHTSKANGASLHVKIASAGIGQASIAKVDLTIPAILPTRLTTIQKACTEAQFNSNPAGCPSASLIATATVRTPLLQDPLSGPVYFVSHGGAAFPDTEIILQGDGVELLLDGHTQITKGVTYSRFETVPDAPFTSFEFNAPEGPYSIFGSNGNLCQTEVRMPTSITAQNGAVLTQSTLVEPEGCPNKITILSHRVKKRTLTLKVAVPAAGKLTATGKHLTKATKTAGGRGIVTLTLKATGHGKVNTKVKLTFVPPKGKHLTATLSARFKR